MDEKMKKQVVRAAVLLSGVLAAMGLSGVFESSQVLAEEQSYSEFILPESDTRMYSESEIAELSLQQLNYARNEIFARHGYVFQSDELQAYFGSKSWRGSLAVVDNFDNTQLSEIEKANVDLLYAREHELSQEGYPLDSPGYDIELAGTYTVFDSPYQDMDEAGMFEEWGENEAFLYYLHNFTNSPSQAVELETSSGEMMRAGSYYAFDMNQDGIPEWLEYGFTGESEWHWKLFTYKNGTAIELGQDIPVKPGNSRNSLGLVESVYGTVLIDRVEKSLVGYDFVNTNYYILSDGVLHRLTSLVQHDYTYHEESNTRGMNTGCDYSLDDARISEVEFNRIYESWNGAPETVLEEGTNYFDW